MQRDTERFENTLLFDNKSNIQKKINVAEYQSKNIDNLNMFR